jgi:enamine deaminase RidA (YjgF/YER057c/UK114 family)
MRFAEIQPEGYVRRVSAYSQGTELGPLETGARLLNVSGQIATDAGGTLVGAGDLAKQFEQVYRNLAAVMRTAGGDLRDIASLRAYLTRAEDVDPYREIRNRAHREIWGDGPYPAATLLVVSRLVDPAALLEVEALAVL